MTWPLTPKKALYPSLTTSERFVKEYAESLPFSQVKKGVMCFCPHTAQRLVNKNKGTRRHARGVCFDFYENENTVVVSSFGFGAPAAVVCLEHLKAFGVKKVFSLGWAGAFSKRLGLGDKVFIKAAFRDEGCSYHYKPKKKRENNPIVKTKEEKSPFIESSARPVTSWTTDAPYRETEYECAKWRKKGASCVEMEASALMTVGNYYDLSVFCFAVISDILEKERWTEGFSKKEVREGLFSILKVLAFGKEKDFYQL